ncbi:MAG TPA: ECF transporter S component [Terriglobales bacterium]|nr:ECF transporter S component [Terriglobales bacterium]
MALKQHPNSTVTLAGGCVFAALAAVLTLVKAAVQYPPIPYLQIDFAEIPIMLCFFLFGPLAAVVTEVVHWLFLNVTGSDAPLGPAIKIMAVLSTLLGFWIGGAMYSRLGKGGSGVALSIMFAMGMLLRVVVMTVVNYVILIYIAPIFFGANYLLFAKSVLQTALGWEFSNDAAALVWVLLFTGLYNVINLVAAVIPAGLIIAPVARSFKHVTSVDSWLFRTIRPVSTSPKA